MLGRSAAVDPEEIVLPPLASPRDEREADPRWQLAQRVVASRYFARSLLLSRFLLHIVAETLEGRTSEITEHQIGVRVFDRPASYRTIEDNIVRNYARQLRRRLAEYFAEEGAREPLHIDIPLGGYIPIFVPASGYAAEPEVSEPSAPISIHEDRPAPPPLPSVAPPAPQRSNGRLWLFALLVTVYSTILGALVWFAATRVHVPPSTAAEPTAPLWTALFSGPATTYIVPSDAGLNLLEGSLPPPRFSGKLHRRRILPADTAVHRCAQRRRSEDPALHQLRRPADHLRTHPAARVPSRPRCAALPARPPSR